VVAFTALATQILPGSPPANAEEALRDAATVASAQPSPHSGGYGYERTTDRTLATFASANGPWSVVVPSTTEEWIAQDGSGRILNTPRAPIFPGQSDEEGWQAAASPEVAEATDRTLQAGGSGVPLDALSTDSAVLSDQLRAKAEAIESAPPVNVETFSIVGDLLSRPEAPSQLRAALYRVAAGLDGVELTGSVPDEAGRMGTAVAIEFSDNGVLKRDTLIFDPQTSQVLEQRETLLERVPYIDAAPPIVTNSTLYLQSGVVDSTSARPAS